MLNKLLYLDIESTPKTDNFQKRVILDEIFIFRDSVMLEYQRIEKGEKMPSWQDGF